MCSYVLREDDSERQKLLALEPEILLCCVYVTFGETRKTLLTHPRSPSVDSQEKWEVWSGDQSGVSVGFQGGELGGLTAPVKNSSPVN